MIDSVIIITIIVSLQLAVTLCPSNCIVRRRGRSVVVVAFLEDLVAR